jgi:hypothetical protein
LIGPSTPGGRRAVGTVVADVEVHRAAPAEAMELVEREAAYTRSGYHGKTAAGQSVGRFGEATGLVWTRWGHSTNRNQELQLHLTSPFATPPRHGPGRSRRNEQ